MSDEKEKENQKQSNELSDRDLSQVTGGDKTAVKPTPVQPQTPTESSYA
jgi:bacteriocin-like protein